MRNEKKHIWSIYTNFFRRKKPLDVAQKKTGKKTAIFIFWIASLTTYMADVQFVFFEI